MTTAPDSGPGPSASEAATPAYTRPWLGVAIAAVGVAATAIVLSVFSRVRFSWLSAPGWLGALADVAFVALPLVLATIAALWFATSRDWASALGLRSWRWTDIVLGLGVGLFVRAIVELFAPGGGQSLGQLDGGTGGSDGTGAQLATTVAFAIGAVVISPVVEEVFFRGVLARSLQDGCRSLGRVTAGVIAIVVSAVVFTLLHTVTAGASVPVSLVVATLGVGLGTGILTIVTGRLLGAIVAHVAFNALGVILLLL